MGKDYRAYDMPNSRTYIGREEWEADSGGRLCDVVVRETAVTFQQQAVGARDKRNPPEIYADFYRDMVKQNDNLPSIPVPGNPVAVWDLGKDLLERR